MLHIERAVHIEAGIEQLVHILPALRMTAAWRVGVRQFIHQQQRRATQHCRVNVKFVERRTAMFEDATWQNFEAFRQLERVLAPMCLDDADDYINTLGAARGRGFEHREGLADAGGRPEEQFETPARPRSLLFAYALEQLVRIGASIGLSHAVRMRC